MRRPDSRVWFLCLVVLGVVVFCLTAPSRQPDTHGYASATPSSTSTSASPSQTPVPTTVAPSTTVPPAPSAAPGTTADVLQDVAAAVPYRLDVTKPDGGVILSTSVGSIEPEIDDSTGLYKPIDPPLWDEALWADVENSSAPASPSSGTSYVYGHACHHHDNCSFTNLVSATENDLIVVSTPNGVLTYQIHATTSTIPKEGDNALNAQTVGISDPTIPNRIVLVTCAYESGDQSLNNYVVEAFLVSATPAG